MTGSPGKSPTPAPWPSCLYLAQRPNFPGRPMNRHPPKRHSLVLGDETFDVARYLIYFEIHAGADGQSP